MYAFYTFYLGKQLPLFLLLLLLTLLQSMSLSAFFVVFVIVIVIIVLVIGVAAIGMLLKRGMGNGKWETENGKIKKYKNWKKYEIVILYK